MSDEEALSMAPGTHVWRRLPISRNGSAIAFGSVVSVSQLPGWGAPRLGVMWAGRKTIDFIGAHLVEIGYPEPTP